MLLTPYKIEYESILLVNAYSTRYILKHLLSRFDGLRSYIISLDNAHYYNYFSGKSSALKTAQTFLKTSYE